MTEGDRAPRRVELLASHHDRAAFACGEPTLDDYLKQHANQDLKRRVASVFVLVGERPEDIAGYYTLSAHAMAFGALPDEIFRRLPRHPEIPTMLIGRLARNSRYQGKGVGAYLLLDAFKRVLAVAASVAAFAVVVDAKSTCAVRFYESFGFIPIADKLSRLFLPLGMAERSLQSRG